MTTETMPHTTTQHWSRSFDQAMLPETEPAWMTTLRRQAWEIYQDLPEPPPPQRNLRKPPVLDLSALGPARALNTEAADLNARAHSWGDNAGAYLAANGSTIAEPAAIADGLILVSLSEALVKHQDLVKKHFGSVTPAHSGKDLALNLAYWKGGYFLYVPRNLQLSLPVYALQALCGAGGEALFSRSLVVVESGAKLTLIHDSHSNQREQQALVSDVVEIVIGDNAELNALYLQQWGSDVHCRSHSQALLGRHARYAALNVATGASFHQAHSAATMPLPGAEMRLLGLFAADNEQHFRQSSLQNHLSPHTSSHLQYHSVLRDKAYSFYNGMIYVDGKAQQTESNQLSKSMLLSDSARADAIPNLEILADDVMSGHGAAIGSIDKDQLFYLQSRGFERGLAENLLVEGFMEEVILQFGDAPLQALIKEHLALRLLAKDEERELDEDSDG